MAEATADRLSGAMARMKAVNLRGMALIPALALAFVIGSVSSEAFLTGDNIISILRQSSELAVMTVALSLILIAGKFDLSLESTFGLAPMFAAWLMLPDAVGGGGMEIPPALAIVACLLVGALIGLFNGFLIVKAGLNAFVVTLAMLILLRGVDLGLTNGATLYDFPEAFTYLGAAKWFGIPVSIFVAGAIFLVAGLILRFHRYGRAVYAVGGNPEAARAAGIPVEKIIWATFIIGGLLAALAGLMLSGRIASTTADQGRNLIFTVFAAATIGGISLDGGRGTMFGALTGVLLLGIISNILTLSQVPSFWIDAVYGAVILLALILAKITSDQPAK